VGDFFCSLGSAVSRVETLPRGLSARSLGTRVWGGCWLAGTARAVRRPAAGCLGLALCVAANPACSALAGLQAEAASVRLALLRGSVWTGPG